ncbi:phosphatidylinositol 4-kinase gamma 6 [Cryptomeria japonica]|uniref:phosphatidylinositol 4-kinase gamma 6 n=1 Tax=Cryptomeria japonica TaxID=3369 RepID=UPI0025AC03A1|nr:phosphatidylinositol 4-kinase gamma 6 [Cryptomeria japonica]XP_057868861.1 phosphatidylinositol 4-kinase gamma 6 [Cryptomeria japonica]XP_057868862.1 phosphatidylinositol 4-kinase gamma 6 [Cryptomeria japonica]XP_057868863.1 phosphatidylinositol 4-kinase gamma 6 [Cryptomeria japonica]XP_057868864.1 phosphatidylinositol 4-kinase gamma 6 [Cryptomeria japonica]XP_057868865.1 phosphatidylinositol 4-kinase gamma 6 [Cryptomeria japonica]
MSSSSSPVRLQAPAPVLDRVPSGVSSMYRREMGLRRLFVQTDIGNVLGIEVDRDDKVQTIKKKLQVALCLPTEQSALTFGDVVLEHDFNEVRNDSPILLIRGLYRTSSTPCISPVVGKINSKGRNKPLEIIGGSHGCPKVRQLVRQCVKALDNGVEPIPADGGLGGAYFIQNSAGKKIAIVKPTDEEPFAPNNPNGFVGKTLGQPGLKRSIRIGETGIREVAAYLLDHDHFAKVPPTALVKATHSNFNVNTTVLPCNSEPFVKIGSLQRFVPHEYDASEHGTSQFPVGAVHRIGILDVRILNTDRHAGNILVKRLAEEKCNNWTLFDLRVYDALELIPIDHGLCLPEAIDDPYFEWLHWPQASLPFSEEELEYIKNLNAASDAELLRKELPMLRESCLRVLMITTAFLQKAAVAGLSLAEIGSMMTREIGTMDHELSELENICILAKLDADHELSLVRSSRSLVKSIADELSLQLHMDQEDHQIGLSSMSKRECSSLPQSSITLQHETSKTSSVLFKPSESTQSFFCFNPIKGSSAISDVLEEATLDLDEESAATVPKNQGASVVDPKTVRKKCGKRNIGSNSSSSKRGIHGIAEARSEPSTRAVSSQKKAQTTQDRSGENLVGLNLNEMAEEEWSIFMECFQRLLPEAFANRKARNLCLMSRLGTSCQF